ncbi:MAG: transglutaminase domain-containing protein [Mariniphaga sp.]
MPKYYFFFLVILGFASCGTPEKEKNFEKFAIRQDSLFMDAYKQRDTAAYQKLLKGFLLKYEVLTTSDKKRFSNYQSNAYYNFCCTYSLLNNKPMAIEFLKKAIQSGYFDYDHIQTDADLNNIRKEKEFVEAEKSIREIGDFLYILKKGEKYDLNDKIEIPKFTYQSAMNSNLISLRAAFHLDSIAGNGDEISKMINLLNWIHNLIPHDGNHDNPTVKNAMSMIRQCKKENRGLNCRGLATVLNECYLAVGFKSRMITCLPKDSLKLDNDCHVINMVYSKSLHKWVWMDPTNNAFVMDENKGLLGIEEVRNRLVHDQPLFINPDANWNHKQTVTVDEYLNHYMAKNLYKLECAVSSEYDLETRATGKVVNYLLLAPSDYIKHLQYKEAQKNPEVRSTMVTYTTTNPAIFWQAPEL